LRVGRIARALGFVLLVWLVVTGSVVLALRWIAPPLTAVMLEQSIPLAKIDYRWIDANAIASSAPRAAMASEDQRFLEHHGIDFVSLDRALEDYRDGDELRGASTITQQVAKNLFLWQGRSFVRKSLEAYFALLIELCWPKQRILEMYLNIAEFGRGIYGVGAASRYFFGKPAAHLTPSEGALLAAVLPNPRRLSVHSPSAYVRQRQDWILWQMRALGGRSYLLAFESR